MVWATTNGRSHEELLENLGIIRGHGAADWAYAFNSVGRILQHVRPNVQYFHCMAALCLRSNSMLELRSMSSTNSGLASEQKRTTFTEGRFSCPSGSTRITEVPVILATPLTATLIVRCLTLAMLATGIHSARHSGISDLLPVKCVIFHVCLVQPEDRTRNRGRPHHTTQRAIFKHGLSVGQKS